MRQGTGADIDLLFHEADTAIYTAKRRGKAQVCRFGAEPLAATTNDELDPRRREPAAETF